MSTREEVPPAVWGPHFWFVIHSIADTYPTQPTDIMKKKVYEFFYNLPLFLPMERAGSDFADMLDAYPLSPYLDSRRSLMRWTHFIHNRMNERLGKPHLSVEEAEVKRISAYTPHQPMTFSQDIRPPPPPRWTHVAIIGGCIIGAAWLINMKPIMVS
jgi:hypothetical protein